MLGEGRLVLVYFIVFVFFGKMVKMLIDYIFRWVIYVLIVIFKRIKMKCVILKLVKRKSKGGMGKYI